MKASRIRPTFTLLIFVLFISLGNSISRDRANASAGIWVSPSTSYIESGYYNIVGEVENQGDLYLGYIKIIATFYDENDTVVGKNYDFVKLDVLPPGRRAPFILRSNDVNQSGKARRYALNCTYQITSAIPQELEILSNSTYIDGNGNKRIVGEIKNIGAVQATYVKIVATCFNATGFVVAVDFTYASSADMGPNQTSPFDLSISDQLTPLVNRYVLTAESYEYAMIPEFPLGIPLMLMLLMPITIVAYALKKHGE
jgi:hypothetical protein